ncbi:LSm family protein [Candidatus Dojkabacteria bacterium]|jgi:small nuclear ribonucleoprotein (snRNP)-like protein|nr:LSm family protein [Candidatus Dojkabacteria bacterium]
MNRYVGKNVFVTLRNGRIYKGIVTEIEDVGNGLIFVSINYKDDKIVTLIASEITEMKEED